MTLDEFKNRVTRAVGYVTLWEACRDSVKFLIANSVRLEQLIALSQELDTDAINFNFGEQGATYYSEVTPGSPDEHGWVEVKIKLDT